MKTAGASSTPMKDGHGAAGAYIAVLRHLGWNSPCANSILTDERDRNGELITLDLRTTCPRTVYMMAERRLNDIGAEASSLVAKIGGTPELEPLRNFMRTNLRAMRRHRCAHYVPWGREAGAHNPICTPWERSSPTNAKHALRTREPFCTDVLAVAPVRSTERPTGTSRS